MIVKKFSFFEKFNTFFAVLVYNFLVVYNQECPLYPSGKIVSDPATLAKQREVDICFPQPDACDPRSIYYTPDGICNNLDIPHWGRAGNPFVRQLPAAYSDGILKLRRSVVDGRPLPLARLIRTTLMPIKEISDQNVNLFFNGYGQFLSHDIAFMIPVNTDVKCCVNGKLARELPANLCLPLIYPRDDYFYSGEGVTCIDLKRIKNTGHMPECRVKPVHQINDQTSLLDLSILYSASQEQMNRLRLHDKGLLKSINGLPPVVSGQQSCPFGGVDPESGQRCWLVGDPRLQQNPEILAADTTFLQLHNIVASSLYKINSSLGDEQLLQLARRITIALHQNTVVSEYLPILLGPKVVSLYNLNPEAPLYVDKYNPKIRPETLNSYSAAAGRTQHSNVVGFVPYTGPEGEPRSYLLREKFFNNKFLLEKDVFLQIIKAYTLQSCERQDQFFVEDVADLLVIPVVAPYRADLPAVDILRDRDMGLPPYNDFREACGLCRVDSFDDLRSIIRYPEENISKLRELYQSVEDVDYYVGALLEKPLPQAMVGQSIACVWAETFARIIYGDRLYHRFPSAKFSRDQLKFIRNSSISQILCLAYPELRQVPQNGFLQPSNDNRIVSCEKLRDVDWSIWL